LLYSHAALQLSGNQPYWDLLIPVYLGDPSKPFDTTCLTCIVMKITPRDHWRSGFTGKWGNFDIVDNCKNPILFVQLEFELAKSGLDHEAHDHVYAMRVRGKMRKTYDFLTRTAQRALVSMFTELSPRPKGGSKEKDIVMQYGAVRTL
jgi:hypothetical protein